MKKALLGQRRRTTGLEMKGGRFINPERQLFAQMCAQLAATEDKLHYDLVIPGLSFVKQMQLPFNNFCHIAHPETRKLVPSSCKWYIHYIWIIIYLKLHETKLSTPSVLCTEQLLETYYHIPLPIMQ